MEHTTKAQAEQLICPLMSRQGAISHCRSTGCMAWEWSSSHPHAIALTIVPLDAKHISDLLPPDDNPNWEIDRERSPKFFGTDGQIRRSLTSNYIAPDCASPHARVYWKRPWDSQRLGTCSAVAAKITEIDTSN